MLNEALATACRLKVDPTNLTFLAFDGKFFCTPEMLSDFENYYKITPDNLFTLILDLENRGFITGEVDVFVKSVSAMRPDKETIFQFAITVEGAKVYESYFSAQPFDWIAYEQHSSQP